MDKKNKKKVLIKRVVKKKSVASKKSKMLAGLGLGATLAGFGGGAAGKANNIKPVVRVQTKDDNSKTGKLKKILKDTFGVPEAKAWYTDGSASSDPFYGSGGGYWYGTPGSNTYSGTGAGGGGYSSPLSFTTETNTPNYNNSASDALHNLMDQADAQAQSQNNQTGSGESEEEGAALPGGTSEGADEGSGEAGAVNSGMVSVDGPFLEDTAPITIPIAPSDNYQQMYNTPAPAIDPAAEGADSSGDIHATYPSGESEIPATQAPDVSGNYAPYVAPTAPPVFVDNNANNNYDPVDNTTGGQYGSYYSGEQQTPDLQTQGNPAVVDGTAGMFGAGSGLDASGNAVFAPSSNNDLDSVWQNTTGQNFTDSSGFGGNWNNVKEIADQVSSDGKSVIIHVVNDQGDRYVNYTYDDWLSGKTPSEIDITQSINVSSGALADVQTVSSEIQTPKNLNFGQDSYTTSSSTTDPFSLNQPGLGDPVAALPTIGSDSSVKTEAIGQPAEEFFTQPNVLNDSQYSQQFQGEGAGYEQQVTAAASSSAQDKLAGDLAKFKSQQVETVPANLNPSLTVVSEADSVSSNDPENSGDFNNSNAVENQDTSAIEQGDSKAPSVSKTFTPTWLKDSAPSESAVLEEPEISSEDMQTNLADLGKNLTIPSNTEVKKGTVGTITGSVGKAAAKLNNVEAKALEKVGKLFSKNKSAAPTSQTSSNAPDATAADGTELYDIGYGKNNQLLIDFDGNVYQNGQKTNMSVNPDNSSAYSNYMTYWAANGDIQTKNGTPLYDLGLDKTGNRIFVDFDGNTYTSSGKSADITLSEATTKVGKAVESAKVISEKTSTAATLVAPQYGLMMKAVSFFSPSQQKAFNNWMSDASKSDAAILHYTFTDPVTGKSQSLDITKGDIKTIVANTEAIYGGGSSSSSTLKSVGSFFTGQGKNP